MGRGGSEEKRNTPSSTLSRVEEGLWMIGNEYYYCMGILTQRNTLFILLIEK
jgi:hypothetical protein